VGWFGHPIFPMGVAGHPSSAMGVAEATPKGRLGVAEPPPRAQPHGENGVAEPPHIFLKFNLIYIYFLSINNILLFYIRWDTWQI
jgi:hypothetical protein